MTIEEAVPLVTVTTALVGIIDWVVRRWLQKYRDEIVKELSEKATALQIENASARAQIDQYATREDELLDELKDADTRHQSDGIKNSDLAAVNTSLEARLNELQDTADRLATGQKAHDSRIRRALKLEGTIWTQEPMKGVPPFRSLSERRTPIVSVLNLKGGVGKTTITAYLGWALSQQGYRVLLIDLDLQGSLSSLFIHQDELATRGLDDAQLLRGFLTAASSDRTSKLLDYAIQSPHLATDSRIVATTDRLAYAELNLTVQWLLRIGGTKVWNGAHDKRMILRRALHAKGLSKQFDIVLLDCPPLVNMCCANALAASDYVLAPITPSEKTIERVSPLLGRILEVRGSGMNPDLNMLGLVLNSTAGKTLTTREEDMLLTLPDKCRDAFKSSVDLFDTTVPHRVQIRGAASGFCTPDEELASTFEQLAEEFTKRLPVCCWVPGQRKRLKTQRRIEDAQ